MIVGTTEGPHDKAAAEIAASTAAASKAALNTLCIETEVGEQAIEVGEQGHALRIFLSKGGCRVGR
jgi:hypothetical protein